MTTSANNKPDLFSFLDYRLYLKERVRYEKTLNKQFSHRYFARLAGFSSVSFLKMVMEDKRNLSLKSINTFNRVFKHSKKEALYFSTLVEANQSPDDAERAQLMDKLPSIKPGTAMTPLDRNRYNYFADINYVILRELVALPDFVNDAKWIQKRLSHDLTPATITKVLEALVNIGLLKKDKDGLTQAHQVISMPTSVGALEAYSYHRQMLRFAYNALLKVAPEDREYAAVTIPLQKRLLPKVRLMIEKLREEIIDLVNSEAPDYDEVYQINVQCFPVTNKS